MFLHLSVILFTGGSLSKEGVSVQGGLCLGGLCPGGFCQGVPPPPPYCYVRVVRILLERILVFFFGQSIMHDFNILKNFPYKISLIRTIQLFSDKKH